MHRLCGIMASSSEEGHFPDFLREQILMISMLVNTSMHSQEVTESELRQMKTLEEPQDRVSEI